MKDFTLEKNLLQKTNLSVKSVANALLQKLILEIMKEFTLEKSHSYVKSVAKASPKSNI